MNQLSYNTEIDSFQALWQRCLRDTVTDHSSAQIYQRLTQYYGDSQRFYHTLEHIKGCFVLFEKIKNLLDNPDALALAIWFHDAIYEPGACDNERRSADWFMAETDGLFDEDLRELVCTHIMATLHCGSETGVHDSQFMVDIDLSSFGMPWPVFLRDSDNVRRERPELSDQEFYPNQCNFQKVLLERSRFFQTDYFFEHYENQARQNLTDFYSLIEQKLS